MKAIQSAASAAPKCSNSSKPRSLARSQGGSGSRRGRWRQFLRDLAAAGPLRAHADAADDSRSRNRRHDRGIAGVRGGRASKRASVSPCPSSRPAVFSGGYAEFVVVDAAAVARLPQALPFATAMALMVQGLTALHLVRQARPAGKTVLVPAAAGGVGSLLVQLARRAGAKRVIAAASSPEKRALAQQLGADAAVDYTQPGWAEAVRARNGGAGPDIIYELTGGAVTTASLALLAPFGRLMIYGALEYPGVRPGGAGAEDAGRQQSVDHRLHLAAAPDAADRADRSRRADLALAARGDLAVTIGATYPLERASEAHAALEGRQHDGEGRAAAGKEKARDRSRASCHSSWRRRGPQKSMPPMPPPPGIAGAASFFGGSATMASVVISRPATEAASCSAVRTTLAGSMMPACDQVDVLFGLGVEAEGGRLVLEHLADHDRAFDAGVLGDLTDRGLQSAFGTMSMPACWSSLSPLSLSSAFLARSRATPPPGTMPSSTAARVALQRVVDAVLASPSPRLRSRRRRGSPRRRRPAWPDAPAASPCRSPRWSPRSAP